MGQAKALIHAPLIAKLQSWGYDALESVSPFHLSAVVEKLDSAAIAIVEKLAQDLNGLNETSDNMRTELNSTTNELSNERFRAKRLREQNERLLKENDDLRKKLEQENNRISGHCNTTVAVPSKQEDPTNQWKAHSMQKMRELESANEALRGTLSRLSHCPSAECKTSDDGPILISERLEAGTAYRPKGRKTDLLLSREDNTLVKGMDAEIQVLREKVAVLTDKLETSLGDLSARDREIQQLRLSLIAIPRVRETGDGACNGITSDSEIEFLKKELLSLQEAFDEEMKASQLNETTKTQLSALEMIRQEVDSTCKLLRKGQCGNERILQEGTVQLEQKLQNLEAVVSELELTKKGLPKSRQMAEALADKEKGLQIQCEKLQCAMLEHEATISKLRLELSHKNDQLIFIADEKVAGQEALTASQKECSQLASLIKELDGSLTQLTSALTARTMERDYAVAAEKREAEAHAAGVEELTRRNSNILSELEAAQSVVARAQSDLDRSKIQREEDRFQLAEARKQAESAERDIEQLKTLITQLDLTREELVVKLKSSIAEQQLAENRQAALEIELRRFVEQEETHVGELAHMQKLFEALGKERDHVLSEMELHVEKSSHLSEENNRLQAEARYMKRTLQSIDQQLKTKHALLQQAESQVSTLKDQLAVEETNRKASEGRCAAKVGELQVVSEHLTRLTCEYQRVKNEVAKASTDRDQFMNELKSTTSKLRLSDQVISAKEKEEESILKNYERLYEENQQLKAAGMEMENQLQQHAYQLQSMEEVFHRSEDQVRALQEEIHQHVSSFQGLERQADIMSRSLAQQSALLDDYQKEKTVLMNQLSTTKQVSLELEQDRSNSMREMTALQTKNQYMTGLLQETTQEVEGLSTRYRLEHERVRELEQLLACLRAQEHQLELENKDTNARTGMLREQIFSLEEQVQTLQITRDAQNQEILRLQAKNEFEESRRCSGGFSASPISSRSMDSQYHHNSTESACKVRDLELKTMSLTADLSKTSTLYKDCCERLQRTEEELLEVKKEYQHVLGLLAKVNDDREELQHRCTERVELKRSVLSASDREKAIDHPELRLLQNECCRLKKDLASSEASRKAVETDFQLLISSVEEIKDDLVSKASVPPHLESYLSHSDYNSD